MPEYFIGITCNSLLVALFLDAGDARCIFQRDREVAGPAEIWHVLLPEDDLADTVARFGSGVGVRPWAEIYYHDWGFVVAIPGGRSGKGPTDTVFVVKSSW